jgi:hypothetical protein
MKTRSQAKRMSCANCCRMRTTRGHGLCWKCHRNPVVLARFARTKKVKPQSPECWACGVTCPSGTRIAKAGWAKRVVSVLAVELVEMYCPACFARWGWPDVPECTAEEPVTHAA